MATFNPPANHWNQIGHFYTPFGNKGMMKYQGIATEGNKEWFVAENPGTIIVDAYRGDQIKAQ